MIIPRSLRAILCAAIIALAPPAALATQARSAGVTEIPSYQHIFLIVMENHNYEQIIGNPHAPIINDLAQHYGLATHYDGVTHPSEPNYVALIGGSYFGIQNDGPFAANVIHGRPHLEVIPAVLAVARLRGRRLPGLRSALCLETQSIP